MLNAVLCPDLRVVVGLKVLAPVASNIGQQGMSSSPWNSVMLSVTTSICRYPEGRAVPSMKGLLGYSLLENPILPQQHVREKPVEGGLMCVGFHPPSGACKGMNGLEKGWCHSTQDTSREREPSGRGVLSFGPGSL